jgi:hypothetical protein
MPLAGRSRQYWAGWSVQFEIMSEAQKSLTDWLERRRNYLGHLSTRQYARLIDEWVRRLVWISANMAPTRCAERKIRIYTRQRAALAS